MNNFERTFRLDRLYHKFLKPKGHKLEHLESLIEALVISDFIKVINDERYSETEKLSSGKHKSELFKLIGELTR